MKGLPTRLWNQLASPHARLFVVAVALALTSGSLTNGIALDDRFHVAMVRGFGAIERERWDLYRFISGEPAEMKRLIENGRLPWWTRPEARTAFFRPLSSLSVWLDYAVLPHWPWLFHLENLALWAALVALVFALYRVTIPDARVAALAALLFAIDDAHGIALGWLANRNALFAGVCSLTAVLWHRRATEGSSLHRLLAPVALAMGLCFGETALSGAAYLFAFAVAADARALPRRALSVVPYLVVLVAWAATVRWLGFGVRASDFYVDPADAPLRFLSTFPTWFVALATSQFVGAPASDAWFFGAFLPRPVAFALAGLAVAALVVVGRALWPLVQRDRHARFLALGSVLCLCLATATVPSDRNLLLAGVGAFGLLAQVIGSLVERPPQPRGQRWLRRWLIATHLVLAPLMLPVAAMAPGLMDSFLSNGTRAALKEPLPSTLVMMNGTSILLNTFYLGTPSSPGEGRPTNVLNLAPTVSPAAVVREDERTLRYQLQPGWVREPTSGLTRDADHPLRPGDVIRAGGAEITVLETDARGWMQQLRVAFTVPLEDPSLRWVRWDGRALVPFELPPVGGERTID